MSQPSTDLSAIAPPGANDVATLPRLDEPAPSFTGHSTHGAVSLADAYGCVDWYYWTKPAAG
jgi:hypothetical protein